MQFWFARDSEVPLREQFAKQVILGILSGDLHEGERLPSLAEISRRFKLHPNTISAAYRQLEKEGWLELRRGSGIYVRSREKDKPAPDHVLDDQIAGVFSAARRQGIPLTEVRLRLNQWLAKQVRDHFLVVEPEERLREIVMAEVRQATTLRVEGCDFAACKSLPALNRSIPVVLPSKAAMARSLLPDADVLVLQIRSITASLAAWLPARRDTLVGVASHWPEFLSSAHTMLVAAGFPPDELVLRDARRLGWRRGLHEVAAVVCDTVTAKLLPRGCTAICFTLLAESSIEELRRCSASA